MKEIIVLGIGVNLLLPLGTIQVLRHQRGGWVGQMMMFDDKVGGLGRLNDDVIKKYTRKKTLFECTEKKIGIFLKKTFFMQCPSSVSKLT